MITPTVGRVVWYCPGPEDPTPIFRDEPLAAHIARVKNDRLVNLLVIRADGVTYGRHDVVLLQDGDKRPREGRYCEWMPYQKGQAAKTEALEQKLQGP
jgi:hypothetical protein